MARHRHPTNLPSLQARIALAALVLAGCPSRNELSTRQDAAPHAEASSSPPDAVPPAAPVPLVLPPRPYNLAADLAQRADDVHRRFGARAATRVEGDVFLFAGTGPGARFDETAALAHEALPRYFTGRFARRPARAVTVLLFGSAEGFLAECGKLRDAKKCAKDLGLYWPATREVLVDVAPGSRTCTHEIVHPIVQSDFPLAPAWLDEGIASLFEAVVFEGNDGVHGETNWRLRVLQPVLGKDAATSGAQIGALFGMRDDAFHDGKSEAVSYAICRFLCQWLDERGLLWTFYGAWRDGVAQDPDGRRAFERTVGRTPEAAQQEWWTWAKGLRLPK